MPPAAAEGGKGGELGGPGTCVGLGWGKGFGRRRRRGWRRTPCEARGADRGGGSQHGWRRGRGTWRSRWSCWFSSTIRPMSSLSRYSRFWPPPDASSSDLLASRVTTPGRPLPGKSSGPTALSPPPRPLPTKPPGPPLPPRTDALAADTAARASHAMPTGPAIQQRRPCRTSAIEAIHSSIHLK